MYDKIHNENNHHVVWFLSFLNLFSYQTIYIAKWFITPFFAFVYWLIQKKFLFFLFNEKRIERWLGILYLSLFLLAGIFLFTGWALGNINSGYTFSRLFMGLLESPAPCMVLIPAMYLYKKTAERSEAE
ncbi:MAG TPA: hypothetical protein VF411_15600 [Bacteroidia bacterium]